MIHPLLEKECHSLGRFTSGTVLLNRNAGVPWFILVPDTELQDILDLPAGELAAVTADCAMVSDFIKQELGYAKVNFAGIGNVVPQMHLHIIGRRETDPCWPHPVWGNLAAGPTYDHDTLAEYSEILARSYGLERQQQSRSEYGE